MRPCLINLFILGATIARADGVGAPGSGYASDAWFDVGEAGRRIDGHIFLADLCRGRSTLDPIADCNVIAERKLAPENGDLLEYLETF